MEYLLLFRALKYGIWYACALRHAAVGCLTVMNISPKYYSLSALPQLSSNTWGGGRTFKSDVSPSELIKQNSEKRKSTLE